jgi:hypothetical protein
VSVASLRARLDRLGPSAYPYPPEDCPGGTTALVEEGPGHRAGTLWYTYSTPDDPAPFDPDRASRCRLCGCPHVLVIVEEMVESREHLEQLLAEERAAGGGDPCD